MAQSSLRRTDGAIIWIRREHIPVGRLRPKFCVFKLMGKELRELGAKCL